MYPFNYPTPQGAQLDIFDAPPSPTTNIPGVSWVKPPNAGMVWITAIGAGGGGGTGSGNGTFFGYGGGGGGGAILNVVMPAIFCPPELTIQIGIGGSTGVDIQTPTSTIIYYKNQVMLTASSGANGANATASTATANGAGGAGGTASTSVLADWLDALVISEATSGAAGTTGSAAQVLSTTTCIIGGASGSATSYNGQYGYVATGNSPGLLTFGPLQSFGGSRRAYDVSASDNEPRHRAPNGAGGGGGGSRQTTPTCPGHQGGHGLVVIMSW